LHKIRFLPFSPLLALLGSAPDVPRAFFLTLTLVQVPYHAKQKACDVTITAFLEKCRNINFKDTISNHRPGSPLDEGKSET